jgi:hypothetical protein
MTCARLAQQKSVSKDLPPLAQMAIAMTTGTSRAPSCIRKWFPNDFIKPVQPEALPSIEAAIEREVALAFDLDADMLRRILSPDRSDRRGFWRYFSANPAVFVAVQEMLRRCEPLPSNAAAVA